MESKDTQRESTGKAGSAANEPLTDEARKLEAVRELLFGQNVQEYRKEFDEINHQIRDTVQTNSKALEALKADLSSRLETLEKKMEDRLSQTAELMNKRIEDLSHAKTDKEALAAILNEMAKKITS